MKISITILFVLITMHVSLAQNSSIKAGASIFYNSETSVTGIGGGVTLEYKVGRKLSVATVLDFVGGERTATALLNTGDLININYKAPTFSFRPEFRFYPKATMHGFFTGIGFNLTSSKVGEIANGIGPSEPFIVKRSDDFSAHPTLLLGLNLPIKSKFCVELSGGFGILAEDVAYFALPISMRLGYFF